MSLTAVFVIVAIGALILISWIWRLRRSLRRQRAILQELQSRPVSNDECEALQAEVAELRNAGEAASHQWHRRLADLETAHAASMQSLMQQANQAIAASQRSTHELEGGIRDLFGIEMTFDRWHADMTVLLDHNRGMHAKNDEFSLIVRQMVIVALNASIEAARAGATGRGFSIVANEMRSLSARAQALSEDYRRTLYENDLITTTTFQDMQAGGRMILGAVRGLELTNRKGQEASVQLLENT